MPAPTIKCEFCENHEMRRDAYAGHVKAKHMKEIATLILEDFKEYEVNAIKTYASEGKTSSMAIPSKMYEDALYYFGVKPLFYIRDSIEIPYDPTRPDTKLKAYPEDLELSQYLKREENMIAHRKFIEEVLQSISLMDFIQIGKNLAIRNPDALCMKKELSTLRVNYQELQGSYEKESERLKKEIEMWKETAEEKEFIADLRSDLQSARSHANQMEKRFASIKEEMEFQKKEFEERWSGFNQSRFVSDRDAMDRDDRYRKEISDLKAKAEKFKCDQPAKIAEAVQKALEKERESVWKAQEKEREAKQKIKEKKYLEKKRAQKLAKKAQRVAEMSDSESDSNSD